MAPGSSITETATHCYINRLNDADVWNSQLAMDCCTVVWWWNFASSNIWNDTILPYLQVAWIYVTHVTCYALGLHIIKPHSFLSGTALCVCVCIWGLYEECSLRWILCCITYQKFKYVMTLDRNLFEICCSCVHCHAFDNMKVKLFSMSLLWNLCNVFTWEILVCYSECQQHIKNFHVACRKKKPQQHLVTLNIHCVVGAMHS
jgi:hypothetical protein